MKPSSKAVMIGCISFFVFLYGIIKRLDLKYTKGMRQKTGQFIFLTQ